MITLDTNPTHGLALVMDEDEDNRNFRIIALEDAPLRPATPPLAAVYIRQAHYVVSHVAQGLFVADLPVPKDGWTYK